MLINTKHKFVLFATHKNASSSLEVTLKPHCEIQLVGQANVRHINFREYEKFILPLLAKKFKEQKFNTICIVREPLDWVHSWYKYRKRYFLQQSKDLTFSSYSTVGLTFNEFVEGYLSDPQPEFARISNQSDFLKNSKGIIELDSYFKYEDLNLIVDYFSYRIGKKLKIPNLNVSPNYEIKNLKISRLYDILHRKLMSLKKGTSRIIDKTNIELDPRLLDELKIFLKEDYELYSRCSTPKRFINS